MNEQQRYKAAANCLQFIYHLRCCGYYATQFIANNPASIFTIVFKLVLPKIKWIYQTFITHHFLVQHVPQTIDEIKMKWESDFSEEMAIHEKITLLSTEQHETLNELLDGLINGENFEIVTK